MISICKCKCMCIYNYACKTAYTLTHKVSVLCFTQKECESSHEGFESTAAIKVQKEIKEMNYNSGGIQ